MADAEKLKKVLDDLNSGGAINLKKMFPTLKKEIIKEKVKMGYPPMEEADLDKIVDDIMESGAGELVNKIDSDLDQISNSLSSVVSQAPALLTQLATIPAAMIQISPVGPTMPNPLDIKNAFGQIKAQASALSSILSQALSKALELGIAKVIPDSVVTVASVIAKIKKFGG
jgi:hypothetical protein